MQQLEKERWKATSGRREVGVLVKNSGRTRNCLYDEYTFLKVSNDFISIHSLPEVSINLLLVYVFYIYLHITFWYKTNISVVLMVIR